MLSDVDAFFNLSLHPPLLPGNHLTCPSLFCGSMHLNAQHLHYWYPSGPQPAYMCSVILVFNGLPIFPIYTLLQPPHGYPILPYIFILLWVFHSGQDAPRSVVLLEKLGTILTSDRTFLLI